MINKQAPDYLLRNARTIPGFLDGVRGALTSGMLGRHLPYMWAPGGEVASSHPSGVYTMTMVGVKDGKALVEASCTPQGLKETGNRDTAMTKFREQAMRKQRKEPFLRAVVPLKGSLDGAMLRIKQSASGNPSNIGFIHTQTYERRGCFSRHASNMSSHNGCTALYFHTVDLALQNGEAFHPAIPLDRPNTFKVIYVDDKPYAVPVGEFLMPTANLAADRIARKAMRNNAHDIMARVETALGIIDTNVTATIELANTLQDVLGMTTYRDDYAFTFEVEASWGRSATDWKYNDNEYTPAVLVGAVHTGARSRFFNHDDANVFVRAVRNFKAILISKEDKVFQADTLFSSVPRPPSSDLINQCNWLSNSTPISI